MNPARVSATLFSGPNPLGREKDGKNTGKASESHDKISSFFTPGQTTKPVLRAYES